MANTGGLEWASPHYTVVNYMLMVLSVLCLSSILCGVLVICIKERRSKGDNRRHITVLPATQASNFLVMEDFDQSDNSVPVVRSFVEPASRSNVKSLKTQRSLASVSGNKRKITTVKPLHATM